MDSPASCSEQLLFLLMFACFIVSASLQSFDAPDTGAAADWPPPRLSFSFNFSNVSSYRTDDLRFEGDATVHGKLIDLTCDSSMASINGCMGRMSYAHAVPFYDSTTGEVASFSTRFTFMILYDNDTANNKGDGMTFFLSGYPSRLPVYSGGGNLGLLNGTVTTAYGPDRFVAVEFDTFNNSWDPKAFDHIGIDISSIQSVNTTNLPSFTLNGSMTATIRFHNTTRKLVASLKFDDHPFTHPVEVSWDLPEVASLLPPEVAVGFSASTGASIELHRILAWSFNSTLAPAPLKGHDKKAVVIGRALVALVLSLLVVWFILSYWKLKSRRRAFERQGTGGPTRFEYRDLVAATDNFSHELGEGAFGKVYRGSLKNLALQVAVKILKAQSPLGLGGGSDFFAEINTISQASHRNLVKLVGWCRHNSWSIVDFLCWYRRNKSDKLFLVYELVPNGNLDEHLYKRDHVLPWATRYQIVMDIGSALVYLHEECRPHILHRDIKPSNILLDNNFNAMLGDFGLSRVVDNGKSKVMTLAVGTEGYLDPQCKKPVGKVGFSRSSDVYSFGIVLLEIACKKGMGREHVWTQYIHNNLLKAVDDRLKGNFDTSQMESVIVLGLWCSFFDDTKRPTIQQAMDVLQHGKPLPDLTSLDTISAPTKLDVDIDPLTAGTLVS